MIELSNLETLKDKRNLLAYSGGTDSNALFFLLLENNIPFDLIHVNYNTRNTSIEEASLALRLAQKYNKEIFINDIEFKETSNFEKKARDIRYRFFEQVIQEYSYDNLILGHNLNDKVEWFLMEFTKGAGASELYGMKPIENRTNYTIVRPLINIPKESIYEYLESSKIEYFEDFSNQDTSFRRNYFRKHFANELVLKFSSGIKRTFDILEEEIKDKKYDLLYHENDFICAKTDDMIFTADKLIKKLGYVLSYEQRRIFEKQQWINVKFNNKEYVISYSPYYKRILITPYCRIAMDKKFKNLIRDYDLDINPKHRPYFYKNRDKLNKLRSI